MTHRKRGADHVARPPEMSNTAPALQTSTSTWPNAASAAAATDSYERRLWHSGPAAFCREKNLERRNNTEVTAPSPDRDALDSRARTIGRKCGLALRSQLGSRAHRART